MYTSELAKYSPRADIGQTSRILVVEDEELIREMLVVALEGEGYEVIIASDGRTAIEYLKSCEDNSEELPLDLVLLDLMLPQINGLDICRFLRHQGNSVPILMLSAKGSETDRVLGLEVGADDYLTKPFSMRELVARCRALLRRQRFIATGYCPQVQRYNFKCSRVSGYSPWRRDKFVSQGVPTLRIIYELYPSGMVTRAIIRSGMGSRFCGG
jgi:two-component system phosphate regulon response regulator PhoB